MQRRNRWRSFGWAVGALSLVFAARLTPAQDKPRAISAEVRLPPAPEQPKLSITFDHSFKDDASVASVEDGANYQWLDRGVTPATVTPLARGLVPVTPTCTGGPTLLADSANKRCKSVVEFDPIQPVTAAAGRYLLAVFSVTVSGAPVEPVLLSVTFNLADGQTLTAPGPTEIDKPTSRLVGIEEGEKPDLYFNGELTRGSGADFIGSVDTGFRYRWLPDRFNRTHTFAPFVTLKASNIDKADADSLEFGAEWGIELDSTAPLRWRLRQQAKIEAGRRFNQVNVAYDGRIILRPKDWHNQSNTALLYGRFFGGTEVGRNLASPLAAAEGNAIARGVFGGTFHLNFKVERKWLQGVALQGEYTRRLLLRREISFEATEKCKDGETREELQLLEFSTRPRDWIEAQLRFKFTDYLGLTFGYNYGELPPTYKLVDHRFRIGLDLSAMFKKK